MAQRQAVLCGYRRLIRESQRLFQGDKIALAAAKKELRFQFEAKRRENRAQEIAKAVDEIEDIISMMRENIVQAKRNERGNFEASLPFQKMDGLPDEKEAFEPLDLSNVEEIDRHLEYAQNPDKMDQGETNTGVKITRHETTKE